MRVSANPPARKRRRPRSRSRARLQRSRKTNRQRFNIPALALSRLHAFALLLAFWTKHRLLHVLKRGGQHTGNGFRRERIHVDASFTTSDIEGGSCGIGIWLPRRSVAIALKLEANTSMEAEILALLAGAIAAKCFKVKRPVIFSDCKSAVGTASRLMHLGRTKGLRRKLSRLAELSGSHRAYGHIFNTLQGLGGSLEWRPREENKEADLASSIGSRAGNMGIMLSGAKNRNHALNDVLSLAPSAGAAINEGGKEMVRQRYRGGTQTVGLAVDSPISSRAFIRRAHGLIAKLSDEVA